MNNKIKKIWYLTLIALVILSGLICIFKNLSVKNAKYTQNEEAKETILQDKKIMSDTIRKNAPDDKMVREKTKLTKKQSQIQVHEQIKTTNNIKSVNITFEETDRQSEERAIDEMEQIKNIAGHSRASEMVEVNRIYKAPVSDNVYYRGVWYKIKIRHLNKKEREIQTDNTTNTGDK